MSFFKSDPEHIYHIVEIDKTVKLPELTGDLKEGLKALGLNPYFQYLMLRFRFKKAAMQSTLNEGFKLDEQQLRYCQAGIYWAGELERDVQLLTQETRAQRPASVDELAEFRRINRNIDLVDNTPQG